MGKDLRIDDGAALARSRWGRDGSLVPEELLDRAVWTQGSLRLAREAAPGETDFTGLLLRSGFAWTAESGSAHASRASLSDRRS